MNKYILILNDGTDEIYNLNGIEANSLADFKTQYQEIFEDTDYESRFYAEVYKWDWEWLLEISNKHTLTMVEDIGLNSIVDRFISWDEFRKTW
jgi:hypothetical protein